MADLTELIRAAAAEPLPQPPPGAVLICEVSNRSCGDSSAVWTTESSLYIVVRGCSICRAAGRELQRLLDTSCEALIASAAEGAPIDAIGDAVIRDLAALIPPTSARRRCLELPWEATRSALTGSGCPPRL